jgi:hypothetical protein
MGRLWCSIFGSRWHASGDARLSGPDDSLVVRDVSVVHPAAMSFVQHMKQAQQQPHGTRRITASMVAGSTTQVSMNSYAWGRQQCRSSSLPPLEPHRGGHAVFSTICLYLYDGLICLSWNMAITISCLDFIYRLKIPPFGSTRLLGHCIT